MMNVYCVGFKKPHGSVLAWCEQFMEHGSFLKNFFLKDFEEFVDCFKLPNRNNSIFYVHQDQMQPPKYPASAAAQTRPTPKTMSIAGLAARTQRS